MTPDEQAIVTLTRENTALKQKVADLEKRQLNAEIQMSKAGVPSHFEDGNDSDDLSFGERLRILCDMLERAKTEKAKAIERCRPYLLESSMEGSKQLYAELVKGP